MTSWLPVSLFKQIIDESLSLDTWFQRAVELGLDAIDVSSIFFRGPGRLDPAAFRKTISAYELQVGVFNTYADFTHPNPDVRAQEFEDFCADVRTAALIGAKMVRITDGQAHPEIDRETGIALAVKGLRNAADYAEKHGVRGVFENHSKPGVWQYADFSHPSDIFVEIAEQLRGVGLGILYDTANAEARNEDSLWLLEQVIDRVECVHIADTSTRGSLTPAVIGTGVVPFASIFSRLKTANYKGWFSIEEASGQPDGIDTAINFLQANWCDDSVSSL